MTDWTDERKIDRNPFEVLVDRNTRTQEVRIAVYRGDTLLAIEFVQPMEVTISRLVGLASERSHQFPSGR